MKIGDATLSYEAWAGKRIHLIPADLRRKHVAMAASPFSFLRGTFYRWAELFPEICPELAKAPRLLAVGDLHVENFGTWRDAEGRLLWGVNDFDEAFPLPYTNDLVRLAASALLAIAAKRLRIGDAAACASILEGYAQRIKAVAPLPFLLEERHRELRRMALGALRDPDPFWAKFDRLRAVTPPKTVAKLLRKRLPDTARLDRFVHRVAGMGSLGRERYVALAEAEGGAVAREAKAVLPSACAWLRGKEKNRTYIAEIAARATLASDPFFAIKRGWVLRRLAPHCSRIELGDFPARRDERVILAAMGAETANIHLGTAGDRDALKRDLRRRGDAEWLKHAARKMADATVQDWKEWKAR